MAITKTQDLFAYEVGHIYDAEHRFLESQQEMVQKATDQDLEKALQEILNRLGCTSETLSRSSI